MTLMNDPQDYELHTFRVSDFKDQNGNTWCDAAFVGVSEPVKWVVKDPEKVKVGDIYYGRIEEKQSKAGKPYLRFYREKKDEYTPPTKSEQPDEYWDERNRAIRAQWAVNQAREYIQHMLGEAATLAEINDTAKLFFNMVDHVMTDDNDTDIINLKVPE